MSEKITELSHRIAQALGSPKEYDLMAATGAFEKDYALLPPVLTQLQLLVRDALTVKSGAGTLTPLSSCSDEAAALARRFTVAQLFAFAAVADEMLTAVNGNANRNLLITRLCSRLSAAAGK